MQLETIYAVEGLAVKANEKGWFFVFANGKQVDKFSSYNEAHNLLQDLFVAKGTTGDPMIGQVKYCSDDYGSGMMVAVVGKAENGYMVQPVGGKSRFVIAADALQEPPAVAEIGEESYIKRTANFEYSVDRIGRALTKAGAQEMHIEREHGWQTYPDVVVFSGVDKGLAQQYIGKEFGVETVIIPKKDW